MDAEKDLVLARMAAAVTARDNCKSEWARKYWNEIVSRLKIRHPNVFTSKLKSA